jgi:hypothetical protein
MELPVIYIFTHDSIGVGEDGPTHQPVEHLAALRAIPGLITLRPGDANEVIEAWRVIIQLRHEPATLVLSRQPLPTLDRSRYAPASGVAQGAYVLADTTDGNPDVLLLASGSEVSLCVQAYEQLNAEGIKALRSQGARFGGAGLNVRVGTIRGSDWPDHRHEDLWRLGAPERTAEEVRIHSREGGHRGEGPVGESEVRGAHCYRF